MTVTLVVNESPYVTNEIIERLMEESKDYWDGSKFDLFIFYDKDKALEDLKSKILHLTDEEQMLVINEFEMGNITYVSMKETYSLWIYLGNLKYKNDYLYWREIITALYQHVFYNYLYDNNRKTYDKLTLEGTLDDTVLGYALDKFYGQGGYLSKNMYLRLVREKLISEESENIEELEVVS